MLKKILYNKYTINKIDKRLPYTSEEILKVLFDLKNVIGFEYNKELRILGYNGFMPDFLGRATQFQPIARVGGEVYNILNLNEVVKYEENVLRGSFSSYSFVDDDINTYIELLTAIDEAVIVNSKQVFLPFFVKTNSTQSKMFLDKIFQKIFGDRYKSLIVELKLTENLNGTLIETTNMQVFMQQLQDTKKKILDEAFMYLGVSSPPGKLAHQSELEVQQSSQIPDLLDKIVFNKIADFLFRFNKKFGTSMTISKNF